MIDILIASSLISPLSNELNTSFYWQPIQTEPLIEGKDDVSSYLQANKEAGHLPSAPHSNKAEASKNGLKKYRSTAWNGKQMGVVVVGATLIAGTIAASICINPFFLLATLTIVLKACYAFKKLSNIDYNIINIEEDINKIKLKDLTYIENVTMKDLKLPDLKFVRHILAGGDFEKMLEEGERRICSHMGNDDYLANLLRNLQIAKLAKMETYCRRNAMDPVHYTNQQMRADIGAIENLFSTYKEKIMIKSN